MKEIKIPFDVHGMQPFPYERSEGFHWKDNYEFKAKLTLSHFTRGRSAAGFCFKDSKGQCYHLFMKDMEELVHSSVLDHGTVSGKWTFVKRGSNYGLQLVLPEES